MLLNSLETPKDFPPNFLSCASHMQMVHCPSAGIMTSYIPRKCDTPSLSNCHLPTVTQLEMGSWEPFLQLCWDVLLSPGGEKTSTVSLSQRHYILLTCQER